MVKCLVSVLPWLGIKKFTEFVDCMDKGLLFRVKDGF